MSIHKILMLGGEPVLVGTVPETDTKTPAVLKKTVDRLIEEYADSKAWSPAMFSGIHAKYLCKVVTAFCDEARSAHAADIGEWLSIGDLDDIIIEQTAEMPQLFVDLCRWVVLARVGAHRLRHSLGGIVAAMPVFSRPAPSVVELQRRFGSGQYAILNVVGDTHLSFRGYAMTYTNDGQWLLGGCEGNRWCKDLWATPGILPAGVLQHKLADREHILRKILARRVATGISLENFYTATGSSLDLENIGLVCSGLSMLRAIVGYAEVRQADEVLHQTAKLLDVEVSELMNDPELAGDSAQDIRCQLRVKSQAGEHFCVVGHIPMPAGYMPISDEVALPGSVPIPGRRGFGITTEVLSRHPDAKYLRGGSSAQSIEIEDWTPVIDVCGNISVGGITASNIRDIDGTVHYTDIDGEEHAILRSDYREIGRVSLKPMVLDMRRENTTEEDLRGSRRGISWELSGKDVNRRFRPGDSR